ncbi:MAG: alpha/beta hydrolase [Rhodothermales bacterium]|nr:alpha/beta hydrolase [Rhodothermales bacterium]MBO6781212.1 alpha/beta hydrolase [Rhodothermales bacterium]
MSNLARPTVLRVSLTLVALLAAAVLLGPRPAATESFTTLREPLDIQDWVSVKAAEFDDIVPGTEHQLIWADSSGARTEWAVVYIHGFSGSIGMSRPFVDSLSARLGANAYMPRMSGHGRPPEVFGDATLAGWVQDTADAVEIGSRLGEKLLLVGLSNGAALSYWAATHEELGSKIDALVVLSPHLEPADPLSEILLWPWGTQIAEMVTGETRNWESYNEAHSTYTTNGYPTKVLAELMGTVKLLRQQDPAAITAPVLMIYSAGDTVVDIPVALSFFERIQTRKHLVEVGDVGDPNNHVIVGEALSPENTVPTVSHILAFLNASE